MVFPTKWTMLFSICFLTHWIKDNRAEHENRALKAYIHALIIFLLAEAALDLPVPMCNRRAENLKRDNDTGNLSKMIIFKYGFNLNNLAYKI